MTRKKGVFNLYEKLAGLSDSRRSQGKKHKIEFVVMIVILSIISGYNGYRATGDFVKKNSEELIKLFKPKKDYLPSFDTIRRVMGDINFEELNNIFEEWTRANIEICEKEWISLDGKVIRGTMPEEEHKFINLVSLFCVNKKQVFSMGKVDGKSNEIPKVQELIEKFPAENVIFRMDALHTQKKTIKKILKKKSFYVLQVKKNQKNLLKKVEFITEHFSEISSNITEEKNRGRLEKREVTVYREALDLKYCWKDLRFVIKVKRVVKYRTGKTSEEISYFISNLNEDAAFFNRGIRGHWKIENSLHFVKDVVFDEDRLKIRSGMAPQNMSLLRTLVINLLRLKGYSEIKKATRLLSGNIKLMASFLF